MTRQMSGQDLQPGLVVLPVVNSPGLNTSGGSGSKMFQVPAASPRNALQPSPKRPPPPYPHPPPPPLSSSHTSLAQAVINNQGHKSVS